MPHPAVAAAVRRFPLLGRPRPACPALPLRIQEITDAVNASTRNADRGMGDAAHALNKAALVASDCAMPHLARDLCWQHIHAYRDVQRPLTILEARYLLEPVLNLARLDMRANQGTPALRLLEAMHQAITRRADLTIEDRTLPTGNLVGEQHERRQLREWVWLQLVGEGVRALALANRWADAAEHARAYNGIGVHLMEGRQAAIIAHCIHGDLQQARALLTGSTPTQPWELEIAACLHIICTELTDQRMGHHLTTAIERFTARTPTAGYASYRARLGLTIATLANPTHPDLATDLLNHVAEETINSADGYAARDLLTIRHPTEGITQPQRQLLGRLASQSGIGAGTLPAATLQELTNAANGALASLRAALQASN